MEKENMHIEIEVHKNELYGNVNYCAAISINGEWFKEVAPESADIKSLFPCIADSLNRDEDFKFIHLDAKNKEKVLERDKWIISYVLGYREGNPNLNVTEVAKLAAHSYNTRTEE